jgi:putative acetyltransferase
MILRDEIPADHAAIAALHCAAFGGRTEARLVEDLRASGCVMDAVVAIEEGELVGHVMYSRLSLEIDGKPRKAASLAPLSVAIGHRRRGIGARLVTESLNRLARGGVEAVIVLGSPSYYGRFGFSAPLARRLEAPFRGEAFMALELVRGVLAGERGSVRYPEAFGLDRPRDPDLT